MIYYFIYVDVSSVFQFVDESKNQQRIEKGLTEENVTLEKLEDFVELVTSYKCRICPFTTPDQQDLLQHFRFRHMQVRILGTLEHNCNLDVTLLAPQYLVTRLFTLYNKTNNFFYSEREMIVRHLNVMNFNLSWKILCHRFQRNKCKKECTECQYKIPK